MSNTFDKLSVLDSFIEEVNSYLPDIEANLERLAQSPGDMDALEETHRRTHTIGGSASMMDFPGLAHVAHGMEDILGDASDGLLTLDEPTLGLLQRSLGRLHQLLEGIRSGIDEEAVIAEDDADYARYQALIESSSANATSAENTFSTANGNGQISASAASFSSAPSFEMPSSLSSASSSMPSFDEVLASFRTQPVTQDEDQGWPEEATLVNRFENTSSMSPVSSMPPTLEPPDSTFSLPSSAPVNQEPPVPQSALDALITSTRQTPAISPSSMPSPSPEPAPAPEPPSYTPFQSEVSSDLSSWISPQAEAYPSVQPDMFAQSHNADVFYGQSTASEVGPPPSFQDMAMNDLQNMSALAPYQAESSVQRSELAPQVYQHVQQDVQSLDNQAGSLKDVVDQLRDAIDVIEAQRSEFKGFLNGSKDALDRMEVWAGKAMGLNLRNSPEQVRRYLPLSVMWVSNTKLKKVLDLLGKITGGVKMTDEQLQAAIQQLHSSIQSFGEAVEQSRMNSHPMTPDQAWTQEMNWSPWEVASHQHQQPWNSEPDQNSVLERVTFERQGDVAALRAEIEALRAELQQEAARPSAISLSERMALEQQIREEVRNEFADQQRLREQASGKIDETTLQDIEARLRSEIEIKVRQDFLDQIMSSGDGASQLTANRASSEEYMSNAQPGVIPPTPVAPSANIVRQAPPTISATTSSVPADMGDFGEEAAEVFRLEAEEHLQTISLHVAALEKNPDNREWIQGIRRATHTLKGAAGMMGFRAIADLSHVSEDLLDLVMDGTMSINDQVVSLILDTSEALEMLITGNNAADVDGKIHELHLRYAALLGERSTALQQVEEDLDEDDNIAATPVSTSTLLQESNQEQPGSQGSRNELSVRVRLQRLDELVNLFGEMLVNRSVLEERIQRLTRLVSDVIVSSNRLADVGQKLESRFEAATLPSGRSVQVMPGEGDQSHVRGTSLPLLTGPQNGHSHSATVPEHLSEFDELELDRYTEFHMLARGLSEGISDMATLSAEMDSIIRECEGVFARENRLNTTFQDRLMKIRLVPLSTLGPRLYRASRAVALKQGKDINFVMEGEKTEVDRTVNEEIAGPLLHLVRNAVNHGIETPELRQQRGKPAVGQLKVSATYEGNQIMITVRDDGNGLDREHIRQKAVSLGLIRSNQQLSEDELISMIFRPGFSTAVVLSEESGRGVGLDVVRDSVSRLRGTLVVESSPGMGTAFTMTFPTSLAIQSAMMVRVADQQFAIPTVHVESIGRLDNFKRANSSGHPAVLVRNDLYPLHMLAQYLSLSSDEILDDKAQLLLVNAGGHRVALVVDEIKGKFDIVMKNLGPHLREVHGVAGGTVLGNGRVVLVLELNSLLSTNLRVGSVFSGHRDIAGPVRQRVDVAANRQQIPMQPAASAPIAERGKHLLVVDDSPSVRRVVSNMLKQHDWTVQMARDGVEALEMISNETPAAVLLDIEMPRMDGYELISTVRAQEQYRTLPLIVLTSRAALKHQQRAMSLGASAYVVKPYQDEDLLKTINSLVYGAR